MGLSISISKGEFAGTSFGIGIGQHIIGRAEPEDRNSSFIDLEPYDVDSKISRRHAQIIVVDVNDHLTITLEDLGSLNGTYTSRGVQVAPGEKHILQNNEEFIVGSIVLKIMH